MPGEEFNRNVVTGFNVWWAAAIYLLAMIPLGLHLYHGVWSMLQTLGANHPRYNHLRKGLALAIALIVVIGNISFPIAVLTGRGRACVSGVLSRSARIPTFAAVSPNRVNGPCTKANGSP